MTVTAKGENIGIFTKEAVAKETKSCPHNFVISQAQSLAESPTHFRDGQIGIEHPTKNGSTNKTTNLYHYQST